MSTEALALAILFALTPSEGMSLSNYDPIEGLEKVTKYAAASGTLLLVGIVFWAVFAHALADGTSSSCGEGCTTTTPEISGSVGVLLGLAVSFTVFAAAAGVLTAVQAMHDEQMGVLRSLRHQGHTPS
jgi:hypothetical protein